jgi:hypothetical protein
MIGFWPVAVIAILSAILTSHVIFCGKRHSVAMVVCSNYLAYRAAEEQYTAQRCVTLFNLHAAL